LEGIGEVEEEGLVRQERLDQSQNRDEGILRRELCILRVFFFSLGSMAFLGEFGKNKVESISLGLLQCVNVKWKFFFLLYYSKTNSRFFFENYAHFLKIRHFHKNTNI